MRGAFLFLLGMAACSRASAPSSNTSPNPLNSAAVLDAGSVADAAVDASVAAREDCAEPTKLTQLVTVNEDAQFYEETLEGGAHDFDPETGVASAHVPRPLVKPKPSAPSRYAQVAGGWGLIWKKGESDAKVEDVATRKKIMQFPACAAGGFWSYFLSSTGRFLVCAGNRGGDSFFDLEHGGKEVTDVGGEGVELSPDDHYVVGVPVVMWGNGQPSRATIRYFNLDTHKSHDVATAVHLDEPNGDPNARVNPYFAAFCGDGALFAASADNEVVVARGKDGQRLAAAPALKGGVVSFSQSGKYISQTRDHKTTVFRLDL